MRKPKKALVTEAIDKQLALVSFAFDLNHISNSDRTPDTVLVLGLVEGQNVIPARAALNMWEAFKAGQEHTLTPTERMLVDLLDGTKGPHEIHDATGLDMKRCEEIYNWYRDLPEDWVRR